MTLTLATCSYGEFDPIMGVPVRASIGLPKYTIPWLDPTKLDAVMTVAPRSWYLRASDEVYEREFLKQLQMAGVYKLRSIFEEIAEKHGADRLVLLCFEKLGAKNHSKRPDLPLLDAEALVCHRRLFAKWWEMNAGEVVVEFGSRLRDPEHDGYPMCADTPAQDGLF